MEQTEISELARQLARERERLVRGFQKWHKLGMDEANKQVQEMLERPIGERSKELLERDPEQISWTDLNQLAEQDPERALMVWEEIKQAASDELESGSRASKSLGRYGRTPWDRAQFLVIRIAMIEELLPRGGLESILIDTLAQLQTCYFMWLEEFVLVSTTEIRKQERDLEETWKRRQTDQYIAKEEEKAAAMMDRFNRMFMRTLRQLCDLRSYTGQITIGRASQVNIGEKQINVTSEKEQD